MKNIVLIYFGLQLMSLGLFIDHFRAKPGKPSSEQRWAWIIVQSGSFFVAAICFACVIPPTAKKQDEVL